MIPKFRAYSEQYGMREVVGLYWFDDHLLVSLKDGIRTPIRSSDKVVELMQAAGLYDKNGVEIFEGDILSRDNAEVYYDDEFAEWRVRGSGKGITTTSLYCWIDCEVIGNIYENHELVEVNEDE